MNDRRLKIYRLRANNVLDICRPWVVDGILHVPVIDGLPDGATVESVFNDFERVGFALVVYHPEFDPVPDGETIPDASERVSFIFLTLRDDGEVKCAASLGMEADQSRILAAMGAMEQLLDAAIRRRQINAMEAEVRGT